MANRNMSALPPVAASALTLALLGSAAFADALPERVTFPSQDGRTTLVGYVFAPQGAGP